MLPNLEDARCLVESQLWDGDSYTAVWHKPNVDFGKKKTAQPQEDKIKQLQVSRG